MSSEEETPVPARRRRARHQGNSRPCRIAISVDPAEQTELNQAAQDEGLTLSAFVAAKALAAARRTLAPATTELRELQADLNRATAQVQKVGTNLNQAVAALNATGQPPGNLIHYARYIATVIEKLDTIVMKVGQLLP
jgi:uncharacterized protein (DUF1778 family)